MAATKPTTAQHTSSQQEGTQTFTLLLFASASSYCYDVDSLAIPAPSNLYALFRFLEGKFPGVCRKVLRSAQVVVNLEYADCDVEVVAEGVDAEYGGGGGPGGTSGASADAKEKINKGREEGEKITIVAGDEVGIVPPVSSG